MPLPSSTGPTLARRAIRRSQRTSDQAIGTFRGRPPPTRAIRLGAGGCLTTFEHVPVVLVLDPDGGLGAARDGDPHLASVMRVRGSLRVDAEHHRPDVRLALEQLWNIPPKEFDRIVVQLVPGVRLALHLHEEDLEVVRIDRLLRRLELGVREILLVVLTLVHGPPSSVA